MEHIGTTEQTVLLAILVALLFPLRPACAQDLIHGSETATYPPATFNASENLTLYAGQSVQANGMRLQMQSDGNLVLYRPDQTAVWAVSWMPNFDRLLWRGDDCHQCFAVFQGDGNLVLYNPDFGSGAAGAYWASNTSGHPDTTLMVFQSSPFLEIVNSEGAILWSTLTDPDLNPRTAIAEVGAFVTDSIQNTQTRFNYYKQMGIGMLHLDVEWRDLEVADGVYQDIPQLTYLRLAQANGFRIKMTVGTIGSPPGWFLDEHPDARIINQMGVYSQNAVSYWWPGLHDLMSAKTGLLINYLDQNGLLDNVDFIVVPTGAENEPLYPTPANLSGNLNDQSQPYFFFCDANAQADLSAKMQNGAPGWGIGGYGTIDNANAAWGTSYGSWDQVAAALPCPGTPGYSITTQQTWQFWSDALNWYRQTKRDFINWQVENYKSALAANAPSRPIKLMLMYGGSDFSVDDWWSAMFALGGVPGDWSVSPWIIFMADNDFIADVAQAHGTLWTEYGGLPDVVTNNLSHIRQYIDDQGYQVPIWGETNGWISDASQLSNLESNLGLCVDQFQSEQLWGFDYVNSTTLFQSDRVTPNDDNNAFSVFGGAMARFQGLASGS